MNLHEFLSEWNNSCDTITVHTSGSTGKPKLICVEKRRMIASARMTCSFLGLKPGDTTLLCMPIDYIAGKMVVVRSLVYNLKLISIKPSSHPLTTLTEPPVFAAMTPMQVYCSMQENKERELLSKIKHLIIGGGAIDEDLEAQLRTFPNAVWSTYGMTETLSHIALRRINGKDADCWYTPFKDVNIHIASDNCLVIDAPMICEKSLHTNDLAELADDGRRFRILGRKDNIIDSGGIKINMEAIENLLHPHIKTPFIITKRHDPRLGEAVTMLIEKEGANINTVRNVCERVLPKYWRPQSYFTVTQIPTTETGKPARAEAIKLAHLAYTSQSENTK